ncbi:PREDICTED: endothelin-converting enzyme 1-like [Ceratosolen solmsi marchali]|uniref:Endothelin-converting enzyme 1-like n=1 Tax=Ceratosolen solmsi marchali TaxID=326594 RepID=A0AAJ7DVN0_9HYME|nr:PREDICTED: endothelin-converting enzyme 1-like [Ceratosolen solmsi marchali]
MLLRTILIFGAFVCISSNTSGDDEVKKIFVQAPNTKSKSIIHYIYYGLYENTCTNDRCNEVADLFLKSVKKSLNPCHDFYGYACGRKRSRIRSLTKEIQEILEQASTEEEMKSLTLDKKFYRSCMEQPESDHKTKQEFTRLLELSNGLSLFRSERKFGIMDWQSTDSFYASLGFEHAFFNVYITRDPENSDVNLIALMPPSPLFFYSVHGLLKYKNFTGIISNILEHNIIDGNVNLTDYEDVIEFNNALHEIIPPLGMFEENITTLINNKMAVNEWQKLYDSALKNPNYENKNDKNHISWFKLLNTLLNSANVSINKFDNIVLNKIEYFMKLAQVLKKTPSITVEKYIHFKFLTQISKYLNPSLARFFENIRDRSTFCIQQSNNQLIGATYKYIKSHVPHEQKLYAEKIINNIRNSLIYFLSEAKWMDNETKFYATHKLKNLKIIVGYPNWQIKQAFVNNYYGNLHLHSNFFENVIKYKRKILIRELRGLKHPRIFDPSTMSKKLVPLIYHFEVNSYLNQIFFPTEYLNEAKYELFSPKLPSSINYGSFGSMIGSILYDYVSLTDNLKYNEFYTRTIEGLTKDTINAYKVKEKCLSNQLVNYKKSTLQHNQMLASIIYRDTIQVDKIYEKITGLRVAFEAYKKVKGENNQHLSGFEDMKSDQLFFLSYAERICEVGDINDMYDAYETSLKVNGVVSNLQIFSDVFKCPLGSAMNKEIKCELFS